MAVKLSNALCKMFLKNVKKIKDPTKIRGSSLFFASFFFQFQEVHDVVKLINKLNL